MAFGAGWLRYPAEDDVYEKPILDKLGLKSAASISANRP